MTDSSWPLRAMRSKSNHTSWLATPRTSKRASACLPSRTRSLPVCTGASSLIRIDNTWDFHA